MKYLRGKVRSVSSKNPRCRWIESREGQPFEETYFFHTNQSRDAGYEDREVALGQRLSFLGEKGDDGRLKVKAFKPNVQVADANSFHNPYHFVPLAPPRSLEPVDSVLGGTLHDRWTFSEGAEARFSGRIVCRLTTETPTVLGGRQVPEENQPTKVLPFTLPLPDDGEDMQRPAIPGSTLRGLLSSLVEAASCSTLRVLDDRVLTIRNARLRRKETVGKVHEVFDQVDKNLVPFHDGRTEVTLAERLFGFVEDRGQGRALAGRISVSHALCDDSKRGDGSGWYGGEKLLQILASPKPPSPAFYFGESEGLKKTELDLWLHRPKGRKMYLHHRPPIDPGSAPDASKDHMKLKVEPVESAESFYFHLDFDHLSREELSFLAYSLTPSDSFRHKLGLGKPLGLGTVWIEPLALLSIDRRSRYERVGLFSPRYSGREELRPPEPPIRNSALSERYKEELEPRPGSGTRREGSGLPRWQELVQEASDRTPRSVRKTLETLGNPKRVRAEVTYPVQKRPAKQGEHFQWFVENEKGRPPQGLGKVFESGVSGKSQKGEKVEIPSLQKN